MPEDSCFANHFELLDEFVDTLVPATYTRANTESLWILIMEHTSRNLDRDRVFTNISIISFNSFALLQHVFHCIPEDDNIRPVSTWEWTHQPNNPAGEDAHPNLIAETVRVELFRIPSLRIGSL